MNGEIPRLLRMADVQKIVGLSRAAIYALIAQGLFPRPLKIGRSSRWRPDEIEDYIASAPRGGALVGRHR